MLNSKWNVREHVRALRPSLVALLWVDAYFAINLRCLSLWRAIEYVSCSSFFKKSRYTISTYRYGHPLFLRTWLGDARATPQCTWMSHQPIADYHLPSRNISSFASFWREAMYGN